MNGVIMATKIKPRNKSAFIRGLPPAMPAKQVIREARVHGLHFSLAYVYSVRTAAKRRAASRVLGYTSGGRAVHGQPKAPGRHATGPEDMLRAVAAEIGLERAIGLLSAVRAKVTRLL